MIGSCVISRINELKALETKNTELMQKYREIDPELAQHLFNMQAYAVTGYREYYEKALDNAEVNVE
jgi:hypothetical protein